MRALPIVERQGKKYFVDVRLGEMRNVEDPSDIMHYVPIEYQLSTKKRKGWHSESTRHSLARRGIKTKKPFEDNAGSFCIGINKWGEKNYPTRKRPSNKCCPPSLSENKEKEEKVIYKGVIKVLPSDIEMIKDTELDGMTLTDAFDETESPNWQDVAQNYLDFDKKMGVRSFVIHEGKMHYMFMEKGF